MTTFDLSEVRDFTSGVAARMDRCDNGEGAEGATLDAALRHYAQICCEFREGVRAWGRAVFAGRVALGPAVEAVWRQQGARLYGRAVEELASARRAEVACYVFAGQAALQAALWDLNRLLTGWVTPQLAVGPAARHTPVLTPDELAEARRRVAALPRSRRIGARPTRASRGGTSSRAAGAAHNSTGGSATLARDEHAEPTRPSRSRRRSSA